MPQKLVRDLYEFGLVEDHVILERRLRVGMADDLGDMVIVGALPCQFVNFAVAETVWRKFFRQASLACYFLDPALRCPDAQPIISAADVRCNKECRSLVDT